MDGEELAKIGKARKEQRQTRVVDVVSGNGNGETPTDDDAATTTTSTRTVAVLSAFSEVCDTAATTTKSADSVDTPSTHRVRDATVANSSGRNADADLDDLLALSAPALPTTVDPLSVTGASSACSSSLSPPSLPVEQEEMAALSSMDADLDALLAM